MNTKALKSGIIQIVIYFGLTIFITAILTLLGLSFYLTTILVTIVTAILAIVLSNVNLLKEFKTFSKNKKKYFRNMLPYYLIGLSLMILTNYIITLLINDGAIAPNEEANRELLLNYKTYAIINSIIVAPIIEEILFRFNFRNIYKNKNKYIIFTGLLFGLFHIIINLSSIKLALYIIPYSLLGMALAKIYKECDNNIWANIFTHMFHNTLAVSLLLLGL